jgi:hypothetical protein
VLGAFRRDGNKLIKAIGQAKGDCPQIASLRLGFIVRGRALIQFFLRPSLNFHNK